MTTENDILNEVFNRAIAHLKANRPTRKGENASRRKMPAYNPVYTDSVKQYYRILPHRTTEYYPEELFEQLSPHRQNEEKEWLRANYEPTTLPVWMDFINTTKRGASPGNYSVSWPTEIPTEYEGENSLEWYCTDQIPLWQSIDAWFNNQLFDVKLADANGVITVQPYDLKFETTEDGELMYSDEMIRPIPVYYRSEQVLDFKEDEWYFLLSQEKSPVLVNNKIVKAGHVFYFFDRNTITKIYQNGKQTDWTFSWIEELNHNWGATPVWKLKGHPEIREDRMYFISPFDFAVGCLNIAAKTQANKQMAEANGAWPHKIMTSPPCDHVGSDGGTCRMGHITNENGIDIVCPQCHGTGYKDKPSPGSTLLVDEQTLINDTNSIGLDRIRFVSPESGILTHLQDTIKEKMVEARDILHLYSTTDKATGNETATGEVLDQRSMLSFIRPIIDEAFDIYEGVLQAIANQRYGDRVEVPTVNRPIEYDYRTADDMLKKYTDLLEKGAPPIVLLKVLEKYIRAMYFNDEMSKSVFKLILATDSVVSKKDDEIRNMIGAKVLAPWQAVLHTSAFVFIEAIIEDNPNFFEQELGAQREQLIAKAKEAAQELTPAQAEPVIDFARQRAGIE